MARLLLPTLLAIVAMLPAGSLRAEDIVPRHGNYDGIHEAYEVKFHFGGVHITSVRLIISGHLRHLTHVVQTGLHFTARDGHYAVDGEWRHARQVHCEITSLTPPKGKAGSLTAHFIP